MKKTGAAIVVECLKEQGVSTVFGYPGGYVLPLYDALYAAQDEIFHVLTAHEQGAAHAADGYARATGEVGVCIATSGPGATNLVTGIANAYLDSSPVVFITGNVTTSQLGTDSFQEVDITGITMSITKHNYLVRDVSELAHIMRQAFILAKSGRKGPVLIDIPRDVQVSECDFEPQTMMTTSVTAREEQLAKYERENVDLLDALAKRIADAKKPLLICGGGIIGSGASAAFRTLAERCNIPVCSTVMGLGAFDGSHPLYLGNMGMHGTKAANLAPGQSDLLIVAGARFSDRSIGKADAFAQKPFVVHIDIDSAEFDKNYEVDLRVRGDADVILELLSRRVAPKKHDTWLKEAVSLGLVDRGPENVYSPSRMIEKAQQILGYDATIVTDVGQHQMWTVQYAILSGEHQWITSGGLGTMGFGLGAALGAKLSMPDQQVLLITGDGCLRMNCNEFATAQAYGIGVTIMLMNNGVLGMVRQWQTLFYKEHYSQTTLDRAPDFVALAKAYGLEGFHVADLAQLQDALKKAKELNQKGITVLIDCLIDKDTFVSPMVAPAASIEDFVVN